MQIDDFYIQLVLCQPLMMRSSTWVPNRTTPCARRTSKQWRKHGRVLLDTVVVDIGDRKASEILWGLAAELQA